MGPMIGTQRSPRRQLGDLGRGAGRRSVWHVQCVSSTRRTHRRRLAWVPRRAGDRGAGGRLPADLLPGGRPVSDPLPGSTPRRPGDRSLPSLEGRDADEILIAAADGELAALVVAGVDPNDFVDPQAALEGLEAINFMVSLETRASLVTERANVVLPVSLMQERAGTFVNWEGRRRSFGIVIEQPNGLSDLRVLAALADGLGTDLGFRGLPRLAQNSTSWGPGRATAEAPDYPAGEPDEPAGSTVLLATWRMALDESRALDGEPYLQATARAAEARMSPNTAADAGITSVA